LIAVGSIMSVKDQNELGYASVDGRLDEVDRLLKYGDLPSWGCGNAIIYAAANGRLNVAERLLRDKRVSIEDLQAGIRWAVNQEKLEVFNLLWHLDEVREYYEI